MQVSLDEIKTAINAGAVRLGDIQNSTGATTGCGRCTTQIKEILQAKNN